MSSTPSQPAAHAPTVVPRAEHPISRSNISPAALKVLYRLRDAGYQSFIVGGAVRDLLIGREPKDFDIATNAHPEDVKRLFRNCRLIGRRFHLAHVRFGPEIIEVATFRAAHTEIDEDNSVDEVGVRVLDERGRILRDNLYGTIEEDVWRRDFTANALYYNIDDFSIWDYVGGVPDANNRVLRLIGDPETRYREDPVRILRAIRFAAKLGFTLHPDTAAPIPELAWMLDGVPPARLFDEITKMFLAGTGTRAFELLLESAVLEHLFPDLAAALAASPTSPAARLVRLGLEETDARVAADRTVSPSFLFALLLWPALRERLDQLGPAAASDVRAIQDACDQAAYRQQARVAVPRRFTQPMREMVSLQPRFERREGRRALRLLDHPRFRAAFDFLALRAAAGEADPELAAWWSEMHGLGAEDRLARVEQRSSGAAGGGSDGPARSRRRRRRRKPSPS